MFASPGEIIFSIGSFHVHYYGITMALALLFGITVIQLITKKFYPDINPETIYDIAPHVILFGIIGARLYYCLLCHDYYSQNRLEIFEIWQGGLSIHGALIGGFLGGAIYALRHKLPLLKLCDIFSFGICLGQAIGRWGNFFNSEAYGAPTNWFLKLYIPPSHRPWSYMQYEYFQPTFLYESIADILIFLILFFVIRKLVQPPTLDVTLNSFQGRISERPCDAETSSARRGSRDGIIFFSYLILYSIVRILIEQIRIDSVLDIYGIPIAQIVSIGFILLSAIAILVINKLKVES